jgi:ABC-type branched-subunit amino acid transport system ATPase component
MKEYLSGWWAEVELALGANDEDYIMRLGEIVLHSTSTELMTDERVRKAYLGI